MCVIDGGTHLAAPPLVPRRSSSVPPLWALSAADRAIAAVQPGAERRSRALRPILGRPSAHNSVAVDRLFRAVSGAFGTAPAPRRIAAHRHEALECAAFTPDETPSNGEDRPAGLSLRRLVVLAGKRVDWRFSATALHVTHHAAVRFAERSRRTTAGDLISAVQETAAAADAVLAAHADGPLAARLDAGSAAILLPGGPGAFLGYLRVLDRKEAEAEAHLEASTWVHEADLAPEQLDALHFFRTDLPAGERLRHMPEALAGLRPSMMGDRRVARGLGVVPMRRREGVAGWLGALASPPVAGARLRLGLACPDTLAAERARLMRETGRA